MSNQDNDISFIFPVPAKLDDSCHLLLLGGHILGGCLSEYKTVNWSRAINYSGIYTSMGYCNLYAFIEITSEELFVANLLNHLKEHTLNANGRNFWYFKYNDLGIDEIQALLAEFLHDNN